METITLTGRDSKLSRIQIELVKTQIETAFPDISVLVNTSTSRGDRLQNIPLQTVEGTDFFTEDIFENLYTGEADIAVHSLKDMSATHFFGGNTFAVVDRDDVRDVAIFNASVIQKIALGLPVVIGTCSPRRELMATRFLKQALPQLHAGIQIETKIIRGNVDTRLKKLDAGEYDGIILAAAGLNRLLRNSEHSPLIQGLLRDKKLMVLPLIECTPAPCQGAIVVEALNSNVKAVKVLECINQPKLFAQCVKEKKIALHYGAGCDQKFGVTTISYGDHETVFAAGVNGRNEPFEDWFGLPDLELENRTIWDGTVHKTTSVPLEMKTESISTPIVFVANDKAAEGSTFQAIKNKRLWAAGSKTWFKLATKGLWVEGCSDGLGLESLHNVWASPLLNIQKTDVTLLTHTSAASNWRLKDWNTVASYRTEYMQQAPTEVQSADIVFWSSGSQFRNFNHQTKSTAIHVCASGETKVYLKRSGVEPIVFPTIQSFQLWKTSIIPSPIEG
jgi:hydroxymethylbilane synthase